MSKKHFARLQKGGLAVLSDDGTLLGFAQRRVYRAADGSKRLEWGALALDNQIATGFASKAEARSALIAKSEAA